MYVLFDNNVFADISENRHNSSEYKCVLDEVISRGTIIIVASLDVLNEMIPLSQNDREAFEKRWAIFQGLVNWDYVLKLSPDLLQDEIKSFARYGKQSNPFVSAQYSHHEIISEIATMECPPSNEILSDFIESMNQSKKIFRETINSFRDDWYGQGEFPKSYTFQQCWEESIKENQLCKSFPKLLLFHLAKNLNRGYWCMSRGIEQLLSFPTVLLPIGYWTHSAFDQVVKGTRERASVQYDFKHTVHAGAVGTFITGDMRLRKIIEDIPGHNVKVYSLEEFIDFIN